MVESLGCGQLAFQAAIAQSGTTGSQYPSRQTATAFTGLDGPVPNTRTVLLKTKVVTKKRRTDFVGFVVAMVGRDL
jgi:hypothetical protein